MYKILSVLKVCTIPAKKAHFVGSFSKASDWLQSFKKKIQTFSQIMLQSLPFSNTTWKKSVLLSTTCIFFGLHIFFTWSILQKCLQQPSNSMCV